VTPYSVALSGADQVATAPSGVTGTLYSTTAHTTGKKYAEVTYSGATPGGVIGFFNDATDTGCVLTSAGSVQTWLDGSPSESYGGVFPALASGDVIGMAINTTTGKVWFRVNGGNWNNDPVQSPV